MIKSSGTHRLMTMPYAYKLKKSIRTPVVCKGITAALIALLLFLVPASNAYAEPDAAVTDTVEAAAQNEALQNSSQKQEDGSSDFVLGASSLSGSPELNGSQYEDLGESPSDSNVSTVLISSDSYESGIGLDLSYGYRNVAKNGHKLPFSVRITNGSDRDISGRLVIAADGSVETGVSSFEPAINSFSFNVEIPAKGETVVDNVISVAEENGIVEVMLYEGEECLAERREAVSISSDGAELLIGLLSDTPGKLDFLNGVSVAKTALRARTIELEPDTLPQNALELEQLDLIVISNFNTARINEEQLSAIETWAENGGVLLIGSGRDRKAAEAFGTYREGFEISEAVRSDVDMGMQYSKSGPDGAVLPLYVCNIIVKDGIQVMQSSDMAMLTMVKSGSGSIGFAAYDLCDISEFCSQEMSFTDDLLTTILGYSRIDRLINAADSSREVYDKTNEFMGVANPSDMPGISLYVIIAIIYIAIVGAGLYYSLRNRGLELYYHPFVVITAFIGAFVIWMIGAGTRYDGLSLDYTAVREIHGLEASESGYIRIFSAASDSYSIDIPKDCEIYPIVRAAEDYSEGTGKAAASAYGKASGKVSDKSAASAYDKAIGTNKSAADGDYKLIAFSEDEQSRNIKATGLGPFAGTLLEFAESVRTGDAGDNITAVLSFYNEIFNGSIRNDSPYDIEDAALLLYGRVAKLGRIKAGEEAEINKIRAVVAPIGDSFAAASYITGLDAMDTGDSDYADTLKKTRFLSSYISELPESYYSGVRLIGFSDGENIFKDISADRHIDVSGTLLKSLAVNASFKSGRSIWSTALGTDPSVISGDYDIASNTSRGSVVLEYSLGNDINVSALYFTELSEEFESESMDAFTGKISIYNYTTGSYDDISADRTYGEELIKPYLSPANTIMVRYIPDSTASQSSSVYLPVPNINGEEK